MRILGSQLGVILFFAIGIGIAYIINVAKKEKMDEEDKHSTVGCIFIIALVIAFLCYYFS